MAFRRVYLDSNILIAFLGHDSNHDLARKLSGVVDAVVEQPNPPYVTSELSFAEVLVHPMRAGMNLFGIENVLTTSPWLEVAPVSRNILWGAANLRSQHTSLKLPDAIHIATALAKRCSHILTADTAIRNSYRVDIYEDSQRRVGESVETIRPTSDVLEALVHWQQP
ncbi:Predicted nucleic acid-binding protein, contains PIN domain [Devosia sp. YR412]|uniref:type II toxin-antitoxin system VapC family toxin n=1 Tax=Devosia sp. YR412 TaxID=1881030 RepID=UPI0008CAB099|nr:PIN domain-containing protein [Devosia sp. YR412]SEQ08944.1 Predicted nucleic acid-binding protein, contains PIN domain [Devosia sp. YR412]